MTKEVFETKSVLSNHSTVTDCFSTIDSIPFNSNKKDVESILFSFDLIIRTSKLTKTSHYNTYQYKLYRLIKFLKEERGIGYSLDNNSSFLALNSSLVITPSLCKFDRLLIAFNMYSSEYWIVVFDDFLFILIFCSKFLSYLILL